jgi:hypothetical protein
MPRSTAVSYGPGEGPGGEDGGQADLAGLARALPPDGQEALVLVQEDGLAGELLDAGPGDETAGALRRDEDVLAGEDVVREGRVGNGEAASPAAVRTAG